LLAQAIPADYANDQLLTNWTKPSYNPIMENTQRDPSTPWKTPSGEWRLRTYNSIVYGAASDEDMLAGKWYEIGTSKSFRQCECPSFYPLPAASPGTEAAYEEARRAGALPTHVHKTSCGGDWWQVGTYTEAAPKVLGTFNATPGWEDLFVQKRIDVGNFYASKDNEYPTKDGQTRRINWGWATVPPASTQTLPREITFNAAARTLQQYPIVELKSLRVETPLYSKTDLNVAKGVTGLNIASGKAKASETVAIFDVPSVATTFGLVIGAGNSSSSGTKVSTMMKKTDMPGGDYNITHFPPNTDATVCEARCAADDKCKAWTYVIRGSPAGSGDCCLKNSVPCPVTSGGASASCTSGAKTATTLPSCGGTGGASMACTVAFTPNASVAINMVSVACGSTKDTLRLLSSEKTLEMRVYADYTFLEVYFQQGRVAMTTKVALDDKADVSVTSDSPIKVASVNVYEMEDIWIDPEDVRNAPRVYK
jgi:sucrose-6-phosphate hydrolase SacC (GH32 family)